MDVTSIGLVRAEKLSTDSDQHYQPAGTFSHNAPEIQVQPGPRTTLESPPIARELWMRSFDFTLALLLIVISLPLFAVVTLLIGATSRGPIILRQVRVGRNGQLFLRYKFRTIIEGNDPRVTPLGRWLRKLSIDELPQLINVLRGEMSLVGPRPVHPAEVDIWCGEFRIASSA